MQSKKLIYQAIREREGIINGMRRELTRIHFNVANKAENQRQVAAAKTKAVSDYEDWKRRYANILDEVVAELEDISRSSSNALRGVLSSRSGASIRDTEFYNAKEGRAVGQAKPRRR